MWGGNGLFGSTGIFLFYFLKFFFIFCFLGPHSQHMEVPRLGVESELQLQSYTIAIAMPDLSRVFDLHHSSQQCSILNPTHWARPGIEHRSSWFIVRFVSAAPQWELPTLIFILTVYISNVCANINFINRFFDTAKDWKPPKCPCRS